tara:strand:- start:5449 stop:6186 length:738 start_codon:yes stop_codon:yes gene_type:complete
MMDKIHYIAGDATNPYQKQEGNAYNYLLHVCNNVNAWGSGFVIPLAQKWPQTEQTYRETVDSMQLGENQIIAVEENLAVVNMIAQLDVLPVIHRYQKRKVVEPTSHVLPNIQYDALFKCLETIGQQAHPNSRFHFPMFGAGLGGGNWYVIAALINSTLTYRHETWCYVFDEKWMNLCRRDPLTNPQPGDVISFASKELTIAERDEENISWEQLSDGERTSSSNTVEALVQWMTKHECKFVRGEEG